MPLRILQVGMGGFGRTWAADFIPRVENVELVACVDINPASLALARERLTLPADRFFTSFDEALSTVECDAVLVSTVLVAHIPVALAALSAGKHVLVEKPFAPTLDDARQAITLAAKRNLVLQVSQNYRFFPAVRAMQKLVASDEFGRVDSVYIDFHVYDNAAPPQGYVHYVVPQPILADMAIHHFDLMRAILHREPVEIHCVSWNPPESQFIDPPVAVATIKFQDDIVVSYRGSWVSPAENTPWAGNWRMDLSNTEVSWTSRAGLKMPNETERVVVKPLGDEPRAIELSPFPHTDRAGSLAEFARAIRDGDEPETSGRDNIHTLALTLAAMESAASGAPVRL